MALTFRISNIPTGVSGEDLLKNLTDISPQVSAVSIEASGENNICLRSIAPSPFGPMKEQVAIVTFNPVPSFLQEATHGSQQLQIPMMSGNTSSFLANFDSHFIGLTPLNDISSNASLE